MGLDADVTHLAVERGSYHLQHDGVWICAVVGRLHDRQLVDAAEEEL